MTEIENAEGKAFVLMPFDESFTDIYETLIKNTFEQAGFFVYRADNIESQQNILSDIVTAITEADVIIADLTDSNPNVYYELGLAHALQKPVVLLTQDIGSVPFDLRSYRVLDYNTHFARFEESRTKLAQLANQIRSGSVVFGNPVSDFGPRELTSIQGSEQQQTTPDVHGIGTETDEPGFLDGIIETQELFEELTDTIEQFSGFVSKIGELVKAATPELIEAGNKDDHRHARNILRSLGTEFLQYGEGIRTLNEKFESTLPRIRNALEVVVRHIIDTGQATTPNVLSFLSVIDEFETQSRVSQGSIAKLVEIMNTLPRMERSFDKARTKVSRELAHFTENVDQLISMVLRVQSVVREH